MDRGDLQATYSPWVRKRVGHDWSDLAQHISNNKVPHYGRNSAFRLPLESRLQQQLLLGFPACQDFRLVISYNHVRAPQVALVIKNLSANAGHLRDAGLIPESGRSPEGGHGIPLQYSCLGNPMDWGTWWAAVHRVSKSQTRLSDSAQHSA